MNKIGYFLRKMPPSKPLKPGNLKDPEVAELFSTKDPEHRYEDLREIGHGAFGAVFYALDKETKEPVAIKKMNFTGRQSADKWNDIIREVRFLRSINNPYIVRYKASFLKEQTCWLIMEYCVGSAADILKVYKKPFMEIEIAEICAQTLQGISHLHHLGRIHRDIKAGNILLTDAGQVKLADLGSASLSSPAQTFVGSPYWMAPEVILAQDSGLYDERADIWSFGITCIELAELKPPFLDMNAYSAMYHIAQNDPPCLKIIPENSEMPPWSDAFHSFVEQCLRKDPQQRLSTNACLAHSFVASERHPKVIVELIERIKNAVKEQDQSQYGKLRKLVCMEETTQQNGQNNSETGSVEAQQQENMSIISDDEAQKSQQDQLMNNNRTVISVNGADSFHSSDGPPPATALSLHSATILDQQQIKEEVNTLRRSKFSTLRTTKIIAKEMQEYQAENNFYEQMCGYKRLRQLHHKELKQLEERCRIETENNRIKLDKEYEQLYQNCQKELIRVKSNLQMELERKMRENEEELRKVGKNKEAGLKHDIKSYANCQKKEYKFNKEKCKMELKEQGMTRNNYELALKSAKMKLNEIRQQSEQKYAEEQNVALKAELKEIQRQQLLRFHSLENQLSNNELNIRARQIETLHSLLLKHHELTKGQEFAHFTAMEQMKRRHLDIQHESELTSQRDYNRRALEEKTKEHGLQSKQQPRELKAKEAIIRKQFRQAVKIQTRQFKAYQAHMLQMAPREEHKELLNRLKEEQSRKIAALADQYEASIEQMVTEQTFKLDSQQEEDLKQLTEKLNKELSLLTDYQERQKANLNTQIERERVQLQDRVNLRLAILKQKINEEKTQFERQREKQLGQLHEKQAAQLNTFNGNNSNQRQNMGNGTPKQQSSSNSTISQGSSSAGRERKMIMPSNNHQQIEDLQQEATKFSSNL